MSLTLEIIITVIYWTILRDDKTNLSEDWKIQTGLVMDNVIPVVALTFEFFLTYQPIVKRHVYILMIIMVSYLVINLGYTIAGRPPYNMNEWHTLAGALTCLGTFFMGVVLFYLLEICTRIKLKKGKGNSQILKILTKKDSTSDYKFSQYSTGSNSISKKQVLLKNADNYSPEDYTGKLSNSTIKLDVGSHTVK